MKTSNINILRGILSLGLGFVLIMWPEAAIIYMIMVIGACFLLPGIYSIIGYFMRDKEAETASPMFPLDGLGSLLLGAWLLITPHFFVNILMYLLGAILLLAGIQQLSQLFKARKWTKVPFLFYVLPSLIFIAGLVMLIYPMDVIANTLTIFGIAIAFYGANELLNWYKFRKKDYIQLD